MTATEPPAETQQDRPDNGHNEGRLPRTCASCHEGDHADCMVESWSFFCPCPCRRAGAGEQQREQVARWLMNNTANRLHDQWVTYEAEEAADELLALLGGPQPDGEVRQHRMDADCWCQPVQAANGAWDHQ